jgi:arginine-tRNA-protein transferase
MQDVGQVATQEQFTLFNRYVKSRHGDGDMATMSIRDYSNLLAASPVDTRLFEWRQRENNQLIASCITDWLSDGYSAVYSFFDPEKTRRSLGLYMILSLVELARNTHKPFVYLGFWVPDSPKMDYKATFTPIEGYTSVGWQEIKNRDDWAAHYFPKCKIN